jgi:hypothetical protein
MVIRESIQPNAPILTLNSESTHPRALQMAKSVKKKKAIKKIEKAVKKAVRKGVAQEDVEQAVDEAISTAPKVRVSAAKKGLNRAKSVKKTIKNQNDRAEGSRAARRVDDEPED